MGWSYVQSAQQATANSSTTRTLAYGSNVTAGDLLEVDVATFGSGTTLTITDTQGNSYTQVGSYVVNGSVRVSKWRAIAKTTGACTVSVAPSGTCYMGLGVLEYSNTAGSIALDSTVNATGTSNAPSAGSIAVNHANELVTSAVSYATAATYTHGTGWTNRISLTNAASSEPLYVDDNFPVSAAAADNASLNASTAWTAIGASYSAGAVAAGGSPWFALLQGAVCCGQGVT